MKKIRQKTGIAFLVLLILLPLHAAAEGRVRISVDDGSVWLYLKNFTESEEYEYKPVIFSRAESDGQDVWFCYDANENWMESLRANMENDKLNLGPVVLSSDKFAVEIFKRDRSGNSSVDVALTKSVQLRSGKLDVTVQALDTAESDSKEWTDDIDTVELKFQNTEELKQAPDYLYIQMENENTILPLRLAKELYGITYEYEIAQGVLKLGGLSGLFTEKPILFSRNFNELSECATSITATMTREEMQSEPIPEISETESDVQTEEASEQLSETAGETEEMTENASEIQTEEITEASAAEETETEGESETETENESETEAQKTVTEETAMEETGAEVQETDASEAAAFDGGFVAKSWKDMEKDSESVSETSSESELTEETNESSQELTEAGEESEEETESASGRESESDRGLPETDQKSKEKENGSIEIAIALLVTGIVLLGICLFILLRMRGEKKQSGSKSVKKRKNRESENEVEDDDSEDTVDPRKMQSRETKAAESKTAVPHKQIRIQAAAINNKGRVRTNNEDSFYLNGIFMPRDRMDNGALLTRDFKENVHLYAVCDGMGGTDSGEDASFCAVSELEKRRDDCQFVTDEEEIKDMLRQISDRVYEEATARGQKSGTTIVMMLVQAEQAIFANVGDSRIYRFRDQKLTQISLDHSKVQRMISMGLMTPEQARKDPGRHVITQYLGMAPDVRISPYIVRDEMQKDDIYILCSDGLTDMVEDAQIEAIMKGKKKLQDTAKALFEAAMKNGGRDNATIVLVHILGGL